MSDGPNIARIAALLGDPARADVLTALMAGRALTATELATTAGVTRQTMSAHLSRLLDAALISVDQQGRHRYFRLASQDVAGLLESLMGVAHRTGAVRLVTGPREPALRKARVCYDHLAGELGVMAYESMVQRQWLLMARDGLHLSATGTRWFRDFGIDCDKVLQQRRASCRPCLDWSERRYHLAGSMGAALLSRVCELGWAKREKASRIIRFTFRGEGRFRDLFAGAIDQQSG